MGIILWVVVSALTIDISFIAFMLWRRLQEALPVASIGDVGPLLVASGILIALVTFLINLGRSRSDDMLKASTVFFEKAYAGLVSAEDSRLPTCSRLAWLNTARLIAAAERLSAKITGRNHRLIFAETREHWRTRLCELIFPSRPEGLPSTFYAEMPEHMISSSARNRDALSEKSLAYLYRYIRWPEDLPDSIGEVPIFSDEEIARMEAFGPRGLGQLLANDRTLKRSTNS